MASAAVFQDFVAALGENHRITYSYGKFVITFAALLLSRVFLGSGCLGFFRIRYHHIPRSGSEQLDVRVNPTFVDTALNR
jgi:hypothetical protein